MHIPRDTNGLLKKEGLHSNNVMQQGEGKGQLKKRMLSYNERDRVFRNAQKFSETLTPTNLSKQKIRPLTNKTNKTQRIGY